MGYQHDQRPYSGKTKAYKSRNIDATKYIKKKQKKVREGIRSAKKDYHIHIIDKICEANTKSWDSLIRNIIGEKRNDNLLKSPSTVTLLT